MQTTIETADRWWSTAPNEIKALFLGISNQPAAQERYDEFWQNLHPCDKNYIFWFCQAKSGEIEISEDDIYKSLLKRSYANWPTLRLKNSTTCPVRRCATRTVRISKSIRTGSTNCTTPLKRGLWTSNGS